MFWDRWLVRVRRRKHEPAFLATLDEVNRFKELVSKQPCVSCGQNGLQLVTFDRNPHGWEAQVSCTNCMFFGRINAEGFTLTEINSRGRART